MCFCNTHQLKSLKFCLGLAMGHSVLVHLSSDRDAAHRTVYSIATFSHYEHERSTTVAIVMPQPGMLQGIAHLPLQLSHTLLLHDH